MRATRAAHLALTLLASTVLAACAVGPTKPPPVPAVVVARPEPPPPLIEKLAPALAHGEPWASLTASFAMQDCADSPLIRENAAMYTRSPSRFEQRLRQALPLMMYVQAQLREAGIPGEFAMLPMLESSYHPFPAKHRGGPAGIWQLMPRTARLHGVTVSQGYDGRLDPVASTRAAIHMLKALAERFDDWRLVDMAYNAGPYAVLGALRHNPDAARSPIPNLAVSNTTRVHLARMLALSCILREPARFHVELPTPRPGDQLATAEVPAGTRLSNAAAMAEISESKLRALNPGYTGATVPADSPRTLLLPAGSAQALTAALEVSASEAVAEVDTPRPAADAEDPPLPTEPARPGSRGTPTDTYRVRKGDTLWSIAHHYGVSVADLKRWNRIHGDRLRPGEVLDIKG